MAAYRRCDPVVDHGQTGWCADYVMSWWDVLWYTYYSPWYYRAPLIVLFLYGMWCLATWLDRRET